MVAMKSYTASGSCTAQVLATLTQTLAEAQPVTATPISVPSLHLRLKANEAVLSRAYRSCAAELELGHDLTHAAEWFLDNYHLVEAQLYEIRSSLPGGYYRQLPKLAAGPFAGYPRVFGIAWAFIAHNDLHQRIFDRLATLDVEDVDALTVAGKEIRG